MKYAIELVKALRYKLQMFCIPIESLASIYCNNKAVCKNISIPESILNKKMYRISYYFYREAVAARIV